MRDYRKYCRPKVQKNPKIGDVRVRLNCGEILTVSAYDYKKVGRNFKLDSFIGESSNTAGNLLVTNKILNQDMVLSPQDYVDNSDRFEIKEVIGDSASDAQEGDIICHNSLLDTDAVFSFNDWKNNVSDDWNLTGLYGITTYEEEDASDGDYVIMANGHTLIISPSDYDKVSSNWEHVDTIQIEPEQPDNP